MAKNEMKLETKVEKEYPDFAHEVARMDVDGLNQRLLGYTKSSEEVEQAKENDEGLERAKEQVKELSAPYRETKKALRLKMRYIMNRIKEMGGE